MAQRKVTAFVDRQERLTEDVYSMWIRDEEMAAQAKPGQFISVYTKDGAKLLPRPISICETSKETGMLRIVYRTVGAGKEEFSRYQEGLGTKTCLPQYCGRWHCIPRSHPWL